MNILVEVRSVFSVVEVSVSYQLLVVNELPHQLTLVMKEKNYEYD
jgi:hypothetical protein